MIIKFLQIKFQNRLVNKLLLQYFLIKKYFGRFSKNNFCRESELSICIHLSIYVNIREKCSSSDVFISSTCRIQQIQVWLKKSNTVVHFNSLESVWIGLRQIAGRESSGKEDRLSQNVTKKWNVVSHTSERYASHAAFSNIEEKIERSLSSQNYLSKNILI